VIAGVRERWGSRQLSSSRRAALIARKKVHEALVGAAREIWPVLLVLVVVPPALAVPFVALTGGLLRWVVLGLLIAVGPWLVSVALLLTSGVAPQAMGTAGEEWTAQELRRLEKRGWHVVTGVTLPGHQIDHVAVGPSGVLVVESKWSAEPWFGADSPKFMRGTLQSALNQANQSRQQVVSKLRGIVGDCDVQSVLVLWSASGRILDEHAPEVTKGTTVLLGTELRSWLDALTESHGGGTNVEGAWEKIKGLASRGDALDADQGLVATSGPMATYIRVIVAPFFAAALAWYAFVVSLHLGGTVAALVETATATIIGAAATWFMRRRLTRFRAVPIAWMTAAIGTLIAFDLYVLVHHLVEH
jgi:hypothetical protein